MRVLGIDPGFDRLGVAVMDRDQKNGTLLYSACVQTDRTHSFEERLGHAGEAVRALLTTYTPTIVALERLYFNKNQRTAMKVAEMRGTVVYLAELHGCRIVEYTPQQIKVAVTGYGASDKRQVAAMVARLIPTVHQGALDDEYDAIAVALTALASIRP